VETHFYISSKTLPPEEFAKVVRSHWSIENDLHWSLDVAFREDERRTPTRTPPRTGR
jgi:predicted transposase YbfD/YdcC